MEKKFTNKEKLNLLFDYYKKLQENYKKESKLELKFFKDENFKKSYVVGLQFAKYLINLYDYNSFPKVISDENFETLNSTIFYRGVADINHHANMLCDYDYHCGSGARGCGIYISEKQSIAQDYTKGNNENILTLKFTGTALPGNEHDKLRKYFDISILEINKKIKFYKPQSIKSEDKEKLDYLIEYYKALPSSEEQSILRNIVSYEPPFLPIYLGYDANGMEWGEGKDTEVLMILNRSKIIISQSEFDRITSASKNYKGGVINFDKKNDDEFLME